MKEPRTPDCPVCGEELDKPMRVDVCGDCFVELRTSGAIPLQSTGEFAAMTAERADVLLGTPRPRSMTADQTIVCSWCGKRREQVKKILSGDTAHICNECVSLCSTIMEDEIGPDWK